MDMAKGLGFGRLCSVMWMSEWFTLLKESAPILMSFMEFIWGSRRCPLCRAAGSLGSLMEWLFPLILLSLVDM